MAEDAVGEFRVIGEERGFYLAVIEDAVDELSLCIRCNGSPEPRELLLRTYQDRLCGLFLGTPGLSLERAAEAQTLIMA